MKWIPEQHFIPKHDIYNLSLENSCLWILYFNEQVDQRGPEGAWSH